MKMLTILFLKFVCFSIFLYLSLLLKKIKKYKISHHPRANIIPCTKYIEGFLVLFVLIKITSVYLTLRSCFCVTNSVFLGEKLM